MEKFKDLKSIPAHLPLLNIDTDMIIPKQFLKSIKRSGFGPYLFDELRYLDKGEPDMDCTSRPLNNDFSLNQPRYKEASIMISRQNFGCGSSREHAPWALEDYGFSCLIAPSFADIFFNNCFKNGILPIILSADIVDELFAETESMDGYTLSVDLHSQAITTPAGHEISFTVDEFRRYCLLNGLDDIGLTLRHLADIEAFEVQRKQNAPWAFLE